MLIQNPVEQRLEITLPPTPTSTTLTSERSLPLQLRRTELTKPAESISDQLGFADSEIVQEEQATRPALLRRTLGRIAGRKTTESPAVDVEPAASSVAQLLPLTIRTKPTTDEVKPLPLIIKPRENQDEPAIEAIVADEPPVTVIVPAPVAEQVIETVEPPVLARKPKVTVNRTNKRTTLNAVSTDSKTKVRPVLRSNQTEVTKPRERLNLASTALLVGGLALVGAKAYRAQATDKVRGYRPTTTLVAARAKLARLQSVNYRDAPLQAVTRTKTRLMELNERGHDHHRALAGAIGTVLFAGLAYAAYKGLHHSTDPTTIAGSEHAHSTVIPVKAPAHLQHLPTGHHEVAAHADKVVVHKGDGVTNLIDSYAKQHHVQLTGNQSYRLYQQLHSHFGNHMLNADMYNMPNGDLGLSHAGNATWNIHAQAYMEDFLKAAAKKKTLS